MNQVQVEIWRRNDDAMAEATLHTDLAPIDLDLLERTWSPERIALFNALEIASVPRRDRPQSLPWDWRKKVPELKLLEARGFGVLCDEGWQGAMMTKTASNVSRLEATRRKPLVYIDYLELAPWNWKVPPLSQKGQYGGLGTLLFRQAVVQSFDEGFAGRVGLHSLPQAETFYAGLGLKCVAHDNSKRMSYFEMDTGTANQMMEHDGGVS